MKLTIMICGSGAREHAISAAYEKSPHVEKIIVAPGNDWMTINRYKPVIIEKNCSLKDPDSLLQIAQKHKPDIVDVAQDDALAMGTTDLLQEHGFNVFGPTKAASRIEWDKAWSREFMRKYGIPHPKFRIFKDQDSAEIYVKEIYATNPSKTLFIKASGLCGGKGALKATSLDKAVEAIAKMKDFGEAGETFLIEDGLKGEEFSFYAISDGDTFEIMGTAQDHKRLNNHDEGPHTGGMGAVSPALLVKGKEKTIAEKFVSTAIEGLRQEGVPFIGILYFSGMITDEGQIYAIEYNARWGDPECQAILPGLTNDYAELVLACLKGNLDKVSVKFDNLTRVCVVGASHGYPINYSHVKGKRIFGIESLYHSDTLLFSAAIGNNNGLPVAAGGRLFSVVGVGNNIIDAKRKAYAGISQIAIEKNLLHYRSDIGWHDVLRYYQNGQL